jgi:putative protease
MKVEKLIAGSAAINAGADAVYIERHCLSTNERNDSVEDIAELVKYAHLFKVRFLSLIPFCTIKNWL